MAGASAAAAAIQSLKRRVEQVSCVQTLVPCKSEEELRLTLEFFTAIGFKVVAIYPADAPRVAEIAGCGTALRLEVTQDGSIPPCKRLRVLCAASSGGGGGGRGVDKEEVAAPNGTILHFVPAVEPLRIPELRFPDAASPVFGRSDSWSLGRAGMRYRDLIPNRLGGRFIASCIHIPTAGPVPDWVHFHNVRFQVIYVIQGWVKVVYEDQGPPFVMEAGDCVLQPPKIRHRVLESSADLMVCEVGCPAEHETRSDPQMELPNTAKALAKGRDWAGQQFCRHVAASTSFTPWRHAGFVVRDTGIGKATGGLAGVRVVKPNVENGGVSVCTKTPRGHHEDEFLFSFLLEGSLSLHYGESVHTPVRRLEAFTLPGHLQYELCDISADALWLEISLPATVTFACAAA
eukprot:TRINITY_DN41776_c0_g1_i2.p1 TRINITY_DN41776_c0_g1~~TRINITY_DN41776_c0_g1_i2.p1  ORF type:complete len:403 (+),score=52.47 TRINITY_DN41776_c0_g1_i2:84-1292(+)